MELHSPGKKQLPSDKKLPQVKQPKPQAKDKQQPMSP